jgi:hypothetical protein
MRTLLLRNIRQLVLSGSLILGFAAGPAPAAQQTASLATFHDLAELKQYADHTVALQLGDAGGIWTRKEGQGTDNGGTIVDAGPAHHWARQCDPGRLDARWFGVVADGKTDDAPALQTAINALSPSGGKVLLPSGRMLCRQSLQIRRSFVTLEGVNCGLFSKHFEPQRIIGTGSLLFFDSCDGIIIQPPDQVEGQRKPDRLGGVTLREFGIAGTGKQDGRTGVVVKRSSRGWGTTDGLLLSRMYFIDLTWAADFTEADMSVIDHSWLSECGNGLRLNRCIYNIISNTCFADNDGTGIEINGGTGMHITAPVFVRNKHHLIINNSNRNRVIGGIFETNTHAGPRDDKEFISVNESNELLVQGATFSSTAQAFPAAILYKGPAPLAEGCTHSGKVQQLTMERN